MTLSMEGLRAALAYDNVKAMLRCVRSAESTQDETAYRMLYGKTLIDDLSHHPRIAVQSPWGWTSAVGAYQAMCAVHGKVKTDTWGDFCRDMGTTADQMPFDPETQDCFGVWCIKRRAALSDVISGNLEAAITKCSYEWASFPPGRYGQPTTTLDKLRSVFLHYGGKLSVDDLIPAAPVSETQPAAPVEERDTSHIPPAKLREEKKMPLPILALLSVFGPMIADMIPAIAKLFDRKAETPEKIAAGQKVFETLVAATGSANVQEAVEKMQADPAVLSTAKAAVLAEPTISNMLTITEIGQGIAGAREADKQQQISDKPFYKTSAVFWISLILLPMVMWYVGSSIVGGVEIPDDMPWGFKFFLLLFGEAWDSGAKVGLANLVVGMILGGIVGVYYGVSVTQSKQQQNANVEKV